MIEMLIDTICVSFSNSRVLGIFCSPQWSLDLLLLLGIDWAIRNFEGRVRLKDNSFLKIHSHKTLEFTLVDKLQILELECSNNGIFYIFNIQIWQFFMKTFIED